MHAPRPLAGKQYHLFGIAGRGMAPLGVVARHLGAGVTGCDRGGMPVIHRFLEDSGLAFETAHSADHVVPGTTLVATSVAPTDDAEIRAAEAAGARWHRTDLLATVLRARPGAGITGSHGKGTVTALAGAALETAGLDPLVLVGVSVGAFGGMTRLGAGPMVAEVDDSDLTLASVETDVAVVTNLDEDHPHLDVSLRDAVQGVGEFVSRARTRVVLGPSPRADRLAAYATADVWRYGRDFSARTIAVRAQETHLELRGPGDVRVPAVVRLIGPKTAVNASLAFATALALGADPDSAAGGLSTVTSMSRRLEPIGSRGGVRVFDDFGGKHPMAVREGIETLRRHFPEARLTAVFEPYGPYLARWGRRYARALGHADRVVLAPPVFLADYEAGRTFDDAWVSALSVPSERAADRDDAADRAARLSRPGDVIVVFAQVNAASSMARRVLAGGGA